MSPQRTSTVIQYLNWSRVTVWSVIYLLSALALFTHSRIFGRYAQCQFFASPDDGEGRFHAYLLIGQHAVQFVDAWNGPVVISDDHVAFLHAGFRRGAAGFGRNHEHACLDLEVMMTHESAVKRDDLSRHADVAAAHASFFDQLGRDEFRRVDGGGKGDSLCGQNDRRVDADDLAARVDERPAGVPRVQGRVGLNNVVDQAARPRTQAASQRADHARGHRVLEAVWVPDGDRELADANLIRIAEGDGHQVRRVDPDHG